MCCDVRRAWNVKAGDLLIELDSTSTGADTDRLASELQRQLLDVARLRSIPGPPGGEMIDDPTGAGFGDAALALARPEGQVAAIKLEAFHFTRYGTQEGEVVTISDDAVVRQGADPNTPRLTYLARIRLQNDTIDVDGKSVALSPGMMASVEIKTGTRRIIEFVLSPLMRMGGEAGRER